MWNPCSLLVLKAFVFIFWRGKWGCFIKELFLTIIPKERGIMNLIFKSGNNGLTWNVMKSYGVT